MLIYVFTNLYSFNIIIIIIIKWFTSSSAITIGGLDRFNVCIIFLNVL